MAKFGASSLSYPWILSAQITPSMVAWLLCVAHLSTYAVVPFFEFGVFLKRTAA
jgi:hypothetical protein